MMTAMYPMPTLEEINASLPSSRARALDTERLYICPLDRVSDAETLHPHITDAVTKLWIGWDSPESMEDTKTAVSDALQRRIMGNYQGWLSFDRRAGKHPFIGFVSIERVPTPMLGASYELNFWVSEEYWGNGYAYEMAVAALDWASDPREVRIPSITMSWTHGNERSRRVIERLIPGQAPEIHPAIKNGVELPVYHYVLSLNEWRKRRTTA